MLEEIIGKITNNFTKTVFAKSGSELEKQIKALKILIDQYPNNENLKKELKLCEIGLQGEKQIEFELKNANIGMYVLHDVNLVYEDMKAQIDYIVITPAYNYFIECKNLYGNIVVDSQGNFHREFYYGNRKIKEGMYSPLSQAQRHIEIFKKIWNDNNSGLIQQLLVKRNLDKWNKSLVVLANSKNILNLRYAPKACKEKVIKSDSLVEYIKDDIKKCDKDLLSGENYMYNVAKTLLQNYNKELDEDYVAKYKEKFNLAGQSIQENNESNLESEKEDLRNRLIEFRKKRSKEKGIPAYYVFTNDELESLLELMPKTFDELEKAKILSKIKVLSHGKEIIKVINGEE